VKTQASTTLIRSQHVFRIGAAVLMVLLPLTAAWARVHHSDAWSRQQYANAERMREALNGRPSAERTRHEYQRVIDAYRRVYFGAPTSSKADPSVVATAELMVEMGRQFDDSKILRGAIEQYRFLRKEYPGSKYRFDALFTIGEVYKDDLDDPEEARATFEDFLHRYPRNRLADDARSAVQEIDADAEEVERAEQEAARQQRSDTRDGTMANAARERRSQLPRVTGVRHWSTPDYTRVAIDVEQEVKFGSQRLTNPDRIYFDLRDTQLASTLVGKTFDVDDGFLKKIRVAEFKPGRTRVVLEVDELARYDAFLLPNPYRLVIDVHGKQNRATVMAKGGAETPLSAEASDADSDEAPRTEVVARGGTAKDEAESPKKTRETTAEVVKTKSKITPEEIDLPPSLPARSEAAADRPARPTGVVKTTVAVPGSDRRIPKTIVPADDEAPATVAALEPEKLRPEMAPAQRGATAGEKDGTPSKLVSRPRKGHKSGSTAKSASDTSDVRAHEARPTAAGDRSLIRALGLKIGKIVIDAGHGGHDTGTIGPNGLLEKDLVLDVAKRLGRLLESRLGAEVIYTRRGDTFIPLETRTAIANRERADLFISIHANSSRDEDARGVETYYLNFTSSPEALEVAARENAVSEKSIYELQDLVKKIALKEKIEESREFASDVQESLYGGLSLSNAGVRNRGIKKAPFIVLIGANMPSILAEISFVSNPTDERKLETAEHRQRIAESLYRGVSKYVNGLSGVKVASKGLKSDGQ
jgi:N-acetylmuramoyl-L-alanine amidase